MFVWGPDLGHVPIVFQKKMLRLTIFAAVLALSSGMALRSLGAGDAVPNVVFKARVRDPSAGGENPFKWKDVTSESLFKGKRCVVFALPGAFTPTCSSTHLPGYEKHYDEIKKCGIDEVYCLSVNDAFVMRQWGLKQV